MSSAFPVAALHLLHHKKRILPQVDRTDIISSGPRAFRAYSGARDDFSSTSLRRSSHSLLQGQHVGSGDGVAVDKGEELLEDGEEGPVGEHADALLHLKRAVGDGSPVHHAHQAQAHALPLGEALTRECLVELDGGPVHLMRRSKVRRAGPENVACLNIAARYIPEVDGQRRQMALLP